jgi:hypothetical protein
LCGAAGVAWVFQTFASVYVGRSRTTQPTTNSATTTTEISTMINTTRNGVTPSILNQIERDLDRWMRLEELDKHTKAQLVEQRIGGDATKRVEGRNNKILL